MPPRPASSQPNTAARRTQILMSDSAFSFFSSVFGFVVAAISLLAFIAKICRAHLPSNKIKILDSLLDETQTFFAKAIEEGLLTEPDFVQETEGHLTILRTRTNVLRSSVSSATTSLKDYAALLNGTSSAIGRTCDSLRKLKAQVVTSSEEGRKLKEMNSVPHPSESSSPNLPSNQSPQHEPAFLRSTNIPRPRSCPPILSRRASDTTERGSAESNLSRDPVQSGLDVRTVDVRYLASTIHTSATLETSA